MSGDTGDEKAEMSKYPYREAHRFAHLYYGCHASRHRLSTRTSLFFPVQSWKSPLGRSCQSRPLHQSNRRTWDLCSAVTTQAASRLDTVTGLTQKTSTRGDRQVDTSLFRTERQSVGEVGNSQAWQSQPLRPSTWKHQKHHPRQCFSVSWPRNSGYSGKNRQ